ncbi:hypothetical protein [Burkholderia anthina]|nr:hypothetical protein [Burkholderia anthina]
MQFVELMQLEQLRRLFEQLSTARAAGIARRAAGVRQAARRASN